MSPDSTYDLSGPLPQGITVLEASAGTGKTYSIAHLLVRLIAEDAVPVDQILVVTYTRLATAELRDRLRARVALAAGALRGEPVDDGLLVSWGAGAPDDLRQTWLRRLERAREDFDGASIETIHGFCQRMLQVNAFESGASFDLELVPDLSERVEELVDDWISRARYGTGDDATDAWLDDARQVACGLTRDGLLGLARASIADEEVRLQAPGPSTLMDWRQEAAALLALARSPAGDACAAVEAVRKAKGLDGRSYQERYSLSHWAKALDWLEADPLPEQPPGTWVEYYSPAKIQQKAKGDVSALLTHPFIVQLEALLDRAREVVRAERLRVAAHARTALRKGLRERFEQGFGDLLAELAAALRDPTRGAALRAAIRGRFTVGLIDEFQDTDALQWEIFQRVFGRLAGEEASHRLVLIGDPKQAIYGFRGANVQVYLGARDAAQARFTMSRNYRSDAALVEGLNHLMDRPGLFGPMGEAGIAYVPVDTPKRSPAVRLRFSHPVDAETAAPIQLRFFDAALVDPDQAGNTLTKSRANPVLPEEVAAEVASLFAQGAELWDEDAPGGPGWRPLNPGDVAVLVRKNREAEAVRGALQHLGLPAIVAADESVFASAAALDLQRWLEALSRPGQEGAARAFAATDLVGRTAAQLAQGDAEGWGALLLALDDWRQIYAKFGFMRAFRAMADGMDLRLRVLALPNGERRMTDLLHLAELAHSAATEGGLGLSGLLGWLWEQRHHPTSAGDLAVSRLETDAHAVRVLTIHKSKGLEFPVVLVPWLWDGSLIKRMEAGRLVAPVPGEATARQLLVDLGAHQDPTVLAAVEADRQAENMRLLYVALTRPRQRLVLWWGALGGKAMDSPKSPLAALLHGDGPADGEAGTDRFALAQARVAGASVAELLADLQAKVAGAPIALRRVVRRVAAPYVPPTGSAPSLAARPFLRAGVDKLWRLHSYSSLTRGAAALAAWRAEQDAPPDQPGLDSDARDHSADPVSEADAPDVPLAGFPAGAEAGTCLHAFFEVFDFTAAHPDRPDAEARDAIRACLARVLPRHGFSTAQHLDEALVTGLLACLRTPLGGAVGALRLCDLPMACRFDELRFDLPLAGGRDWQPGAPTIEAEALAEALAAAPSPGISAAYLDHLRSLPFGRLRLAGFMTGAIDLVFRHPVDGRFFVVDYKSNRIDPGASRRYPVGNFVPPLLQAEMEHHHYHLQYLLYSMAVHRYLRHRLGARYDLERDLGGVYYLFFRGMVGEGLDAAGDAPHGVFHDRPPVAVIEALDALFDHPGEPA